MSNSFFKEALQLSAVGISKLLKSSAKVIETAADVVDWPEVKVIQRGDSTVLVYDLLDLDPSEFQVSHNAQSIHLSIRPFCQDYLIPNIASLSRFSGLSPKKLGKLSSFANAHQNLRWSTCTADELRSFFSDWIFNVEGERDGQMWQSRAMVMLRPLISGGIRMRDAGACTLSAAWLKANMQLDSYISLIYDDYFEHSELMTYLENLPAFHVEEAKAGNTSPKCYEQHGHMTMQFLDLLPTDHKSGFVHTVRRPDRDIAHNLSRPIISAEAVQVENRLEITVKHPSKEFVRVNVKV
jgi:hypothetical protein